MGGICCCCRQRTVAKAPENVVICGGSFAGIKVAQSLRNVPEVNVIVVEPKDYYEYTPGILRTYVRPNHCDSVLRDFATLAKSNGFEWVRGKAVEIQPKESNYGNEQGTIRVAMNDDPAAQPRVIPYSYLVWAAGSSYASPAKPSDASLTLQARVQELHATAQAIASSQGVLVIGGGPVGVELVGEIKQQFPDKTVHVATSTPSLLHTLPPRAGEAAEAWMRQRGVHIHKNEFIKNVPPDALCTGSSTFELQIRRLSTAAGEISVDTVFLCAGYKPNPPPLRCHELMAAESRARAADVNDHLQLKGFRRIFVVGDAMAHPAVQEKLAHTAELSAIGASNVIRALKARASLPRFPHSVSKSSSIPKIMVVSLGASEAIIVFNGVVFSNALFRRMGAFLKYVIEVSKVWQTEGRLLAEKFWDVSDGMAMVVHRLLCRRAPSIRCDSPQGGLWQANNSGVH